MLRDAVAADAAAIAQLHLDVRNATYTGLMPQPALDADTFELRHAMWVERLADPQRHIIASERDGRIVAFACAGPMRPPAPGRLPLPGFDAYLDSLYIDPSGHGRGLGKALVHEIASRLSAAGFRSLALHTLANNPARGFYEHLGARFILEERVEGAGQHWFHVAYGWEDMTVL